MFKKFTNACVNIMNKYLPDPFIFALLLTFVVYVAGILVTKQTPLQMLGAWSGGFWNLLAFSMQMALVLVLGNAMAKAKVFKNILQKVAKSAKTPARAIMITAFISAVACWINWGFGLVLGALLAREMAKEVDKVDYRLLIASAYSGFAVWHGGLSGSIPLQIAGEGKLAEVTKGALDVVVPTSATIFSPMNLTISALIIILLPLACYAMMPDKEHTFVVDKALLEDKERKEEAAKTPADKLEKSKVLWILALILGFAVIVLKIQKDGLQLDLNFVNFIFMFVGLLLHGNIRNYIDAIMDSAASSGGIILQFPFYAGIMGMMTAGHPETGVSLAGAISTWFVSISTARTFPLLTFLSAGVVNFFVPSGGGQWAVQAPIMMPAGAKLGVETAKTAMAIAWGDAWTNMIQPFWALPALGIAGLSAKDIMGYCVITLLLTGGIVGVALLVF